MTPEKKVQNSIIEYCKELYKQGYKVYVERRQAGGFNYKMGIPDLYIVINGQHIEVEVKAPNGHLRPMQEKFRDLCLKLNIHWYCVNNVDEFIKIVKGELVQ